MFKKHLSLICGWRGLQESRHKETRRVFETYRNNQPKHQHMVSKLLGESEEADSNYRLSPAPVYCDSHASSPLGSWNHLLTSSSLETASSSTAPAGITSSCDSARLRHDCTRFCNVLREHNSALSSLSVADSCQATV